MIKIDIKKGYVNIQGEPEIVACEIAYVLDIIKRKVNPPLLIFSSLVATFMTESLNQSEREEFLKEIKIALIEYYEK